jgi:hypothetical protein
MLSISKLRAHHSKNLQLIRNLRSALHHRNLLIADLKSTIRHLKSSPHTRSSLKTEN